MPEPLKNLYNKTFISTLSNEIKKEYKAFDIKGFTSSIFNRRWKDEELKQRMRHITESVHEFLPADYKKTLAILKPVSSNFSGFEPMFFPDYVECYGLDDFKSSILALETFTKYSSSEFAVRPFIIEQEKRMMAQMKKWSLSKNHHVRRLSSEGCRPRLPWAMALPKYKNDPEPVIDLLLGLLDDDSEYVRRSVANNLNDISKDHPEKIFKITKQHLGQSENTDRLLKHACRTLLKQGDTKTLQLFGYAKPTHVIIDGFDVQTSTHIGDTLDFSFSIRSIKGDIGKTRIEYAIDFMKANGSLSRKVFKLSELIIKDNLRKYTKNHSFKIISTRKYHAGIHGLAIIINGKEMTAGDFQLLTRS